MKNLALLTLCLSFACVVHGQNITGVIKYNNSGTIHPDAGAKIFLCHRTQEMHLDVSKISRKEGLLREFDLCLKGTAKQKAKHRKTLSHQLNVNDSADFHRCLEESEHEENKIATAKDVEIRIADSAGHYSFSNVPSGSYWVLIRSGNTNKLNCIAIDFAGNWTVINRLFDEYSERENRKFYSDTTLH